MMNHLHPDQLAALALDPDLGGPDDAEHLDACARCRRELAVLREVSARARAAHPEEPAPAPPESVWDDVVRELSASGELRLTTAAAERSWAPWAVAAALLIVALIAATLLLPVNATAVVAQADLEPLARVPEAHAVLTADDGERVLTVDAPDLPRINGYYELWLLSQDGERLVSLGPVDGPRRYDIPPTIDTTVYSVVDISREPPDGDPSHSTDSVLRGALQPTA